MADSARFSAARARPSSSAEISSNGDAAADVDGFVKLPDVVNSVPNIGPEADPPEREGAAVEPDPEVDEPNKESSKASTILRVVEVAGLAVYADPPDREDSPDAERGKPESS